jgi:hypothetical protein
MVGGYWHFKETTASMFMVEILLDIYKTAMCHNPEEQNVVFKIYITCMNPITTATT